MCVTAVQGSGRAGHDWEKGLPKFEELVPLNQTLITPILASAFSIRETEATTTVEDVERAAKASLFRECRPICVQYVRDTNV